MLMNGEISVSGIRETNIRDGRSSSALFDREILITEGIRSFLLRRKHDQTLQWIDQVYSAVPELASRWEIRSFLPNQMSRYGLVLHAKSGKYGDVILKFIPGFVGRFERELEAIRILPKSYMCSLIDAAEDFGCMLLKEITPARFACFEESSKLTAFFSHVIGDAVLCTDSLRLRHIPYYFDELTEKISNAAAMPYARELIEPELIYAAELYEAVFRDAKRYVMHGDLHEMNILDNGRRFYGIDPNGMLGPIELECVRFIRNDVRNHPSFGFEQRYEMLLHTFSRFVDISRLQDIFIIDMAFCTFNSVFENDDPKETYDDLELIRIAKERKTKVVNDFSVCPVVT